MSDYGERVAQHLSHFLDDPRAIRSAKPFLEQLDIAGGLRKPSAAAADSAKNDSNALYLHKKNGEIATVLIAALIEPRGSFSRMPPYFNATSYQGNPRVSEIRICLTANITHRAGSRTSRKLFLV